MASTGCARLEKQPADGRTNRIGCCAWLVDHSTDRVMWGYHREIAAIRRHTRRQVDCSPKFIDSFRDSPGLQVDIPQLIVKARIGCPANGDTSAEQLDRVVVSSQFHQ